MKVVSLSITINGVDYTLPTFENSSIKITKVESTIDNLASQGIYTQNFRVPNSPELIEAIGNIGDLSETSLIDLNKSFDGSILIDGIDRFIGKFQFIQAINDTDLDITEVELSFRGSQTDVKSVLENISMAQLFEGEVLDYTYAEFEDYATDPGTYIDNNGYAFPLIDYGQRFSVGDTFTPVNDESNPLDITDFKPAVTFKKCLDLMPLSIDYAFDVEDLIEKQFIVLHNSESPTPILDAAPLDYTGFMDRTVSTNYTSLLSWTKANFNQSTNYRFNQFNVTNDEYTAPLSGEYTINIRGPFNINHTFAGSNTVLFMSFRFVIDGVNGNVFGKQSKRYFISGTTKEFNFNITQKVELLEGQTIKLEFFISGFGSITATQETNFTFDVVRGPSLTNVSQVLISENCPELSSWDLLRTILMQSNGRLIDNKDGTYTINSWNVWKDLGSDVNSINLNNREDPEKDVTVVPFSKEGPKSIKFTYQEDKDYLNLKYTELTNEVYGELVISDTGTDFSTEELELKIPFSSCPIAPMESGGPPIPKFYDENFQTIKTKPKILYYGGGELVDIYFADLFSSDEGQFTLPYFGHWESLAGGYTNDDYNFGSSLTFFAATDYPNNTLYNRYWKDYIEEKYTRNSRSIEGDFFFSQSEFDLLELNERCYYNNVIVRLNSVNDFELTSNEPARVEATLVNQVSKIDIAPFFPYDVVNSVVQWRDSEDNSIVGESPTPSADLEESALAYGFYYDSRINKAIQRGQILEI